MFGSNTDKIVLFSKIYEGHYKIALNMFLEKPILVMEQKFSDIIVLNLKILLVAMLAQHIHIIF